MKNQAKIDNALEAVCQQGCIAVEQIIKAFEQGEAPVEARGFSEAECRQLLDELKLVMQTYEH